MWTRLGLIASGILALIGLVSSGISGLLIVSGLIATGTAVYALATGRPSWAMIRTRPVGILLLVGAIVVIGAGAGLAPKNTASAPVALTLQSDSESGTTPTPKAVAITTKEEVVTEAIPFESTTVEDPNIAAGVVQVTTVGVPGVRTVTYRVTFKDGKETGRVVIGDVTSVAPVTQVTSNGTYVEPAPIVPFADSGSGCDSNYSGGCVPIASDVDCAGGSGNGPAYVSGPVYVVGSDIYDLDRDGDGVACD